MSEAAPPPVTFNAPFQCTVTIGVPPTTTGGRVFTFEDVLVGAKAEHSFAEALNRFGTGPGNVFTIEVKRVDVYGAGTGYLQVSRYNIHHAPFERYPNVDTERNLKQGGINTFTTTIDRKPHYGFDIPESETKARMFNNTAAPVDDTFTLRDPIIALKYFVSSNTPTFDYAYCIFNVVLRRILNVIPTPLSIDDIHEAIKMKGNSYKNLMEIVKKREHDEEQIYKIDKIKRLCLPTNAVA